jgi:hypothetical protein
MNEIIRLEEERKLDTFISNNLDNFKFNPIDCLMEYLHTNNFVKLTFGIYSEDLPIELYKKSAISSIYINNFDKLDYCYTYINNKCIDFNNQVVEINNIRSKIWSFFESLSKFNVDIMTSYDIFKLIITDRDVSIIFIIDCEFEHVYELIDLISSSLKSY